MGRPGRAMTSDNPLHAHRLNRLRGVNEGLALGNAASRTAELHRIGAQPLRRQRETVSSSRAVLEKKIRAGFSCQQRYLVSAAVGHFFELLGDVQQSGDLFRGETLQVEQMAAVPSLGKLQFVGYHSGHFSGVQRERESSATSDGHTLSDPAESGEVPEIDFLDLVTRILLVTRVLLVARTPAYRASPFASGERRFVDPSIAWNSLDSRTVYWCKAMTQTK